MTVFGPHLRQYVALTKRANTRQSVAAAMPPTYNRPSAIGGTKQKGNKTCAPVPHEKPFAPTPDPPADQEKLWNLESNVGPLTVPAKLPKAGGSSDGRM